MIYKVVIVDDEKIMREGLANIVDWSHLGFEVVAKLEDGLDVLEYIEDHPVDVVLTDIKMTFLSGIDLAKNIYEQNLPIKVVLISGYQEFELARKAISFNVAGYLLKPPRLNDIENIFIELKKSLDLSAGEKKKQIEKQEKYNEMAIVLQEQFFMDLLLGALRSEIEIRKRVKLLEMEIDVENSTCCVIQINFDALEEYINSKWGYGWEGIYQAIRNILYIEDLEISYYSFRNLKESIQVLAVLKTSMDEEAFRSKVQFFANNVMSSIKSIFDLNASYKIGTLFKSLLALAMATSQTLQVDKIHEIDFVIGSKDNFSGLVEQTKLLFTHVMDCNFALSKSLFERLIADISHLDIKVVHNFIMKLFITLNNKLLNNGIKTSILEIEGEGFVELNKKINVNDICSWGINKIKEIIDEVAKFSKVPNGNIINRVKSYIKENYSKDITLDDISDLVYLNPVYFSRLFKEQTGGNYVDYLIKVRMEKAKELLKDQHYKVYEISERVGYKSLKYFYNIFKRYSGQTPTDYRKSLYGVSDE